MSLHYPIFMNLQGTTSLVVGGGAVGERKVLGLLESGSGVRLVSLEVTSKLMNLAESQQIELFREPYRSEHLTSMKLVFAATDNPSVNQKIAEDAAKCHILCNRADSGADGDFVTPSVVRRGDLCIGFTTGNNFPALTSKISKELEARFNPAYADFVALLGEMRIDIHAATEEPNLRKAAALSLLNAEDQLLTLLRSGENTLARSTALEIVSNAVETGRVL